MKVEDLLSCEESLCPVRVDNPFFKIEGPTSYDDLKPHHLLFLKDKLFFGRLASSSGHPALGQMALLVCEKLLEKIEKDRDWEDISKKIPVILKTCAFDRALTSLSKKFYEKEFAGIDFLRDGRDNSSRIHPSAKIAPGVFIGQNVLIDKNVQIHSGVSIGANSKIGEGTILFSNCVLYPKTQIGKFCRIHAHASLGSDGFGYNFYEKKHHKIWHMGGVLIGDEVEIGANTTIDGGTFSPTVIGEGSKIDNGVQVGHNCILGKGVILCGHVGISGSCKIGDFSLFAGKAGMANGMTIGKNVQVAGGALIGCDWPDNSIIAGHPARPLKEWLKGLAYLRSKSLNKEHGNVVGQGKS
jgi:UDP-3-O-[3-hydroxymyristoyl] glucosamine N-acyltransferase